MKGEHHYIAESRRYESEPDDEQEVKPLPEMAKCPYCHCWLEYGSEDGDEARCLTDGCKFDPTKTEDENRKAYAEKFHV